MSEQTIKVVDNMDKTEEEKVSSPELWSRRLEFYMQITAASTAIIVIAILFLLFYFIRGALILFALAFLASYIVSPIVRLFDRWRVNRLLIVSIFYVLFVAGVVLCVIFLLPMLWDELLDLQTGIQNTLSDPGFGNNLSIRLEAIKARLARTFPLIANVDIAAQLKIDKGLSGAASWLTDYIGQVMKAVTSFSGKIIWLIIAMILIPFITFFLLKDGDSIKRAMIRIIPGRYSGTTVEVLQKIDRQIGRYIRGRIAEALILSALTIIGLRILGVKYYLVIGGIAGFANLIPYIGPVMIGIPPVILAGYQYGFFHMLVTSIFLISLQIIDNTILVPLIVGKSVDLHPIVTIFVVIVGGQLLGFLGMIVAVPLASILIALFQALYKEFKNYSAPV